MGRVFPREWDRFVSLLSPDERDGDIARGYARLLFDPDAEVRARAASEWCLWEDTHVSLMPDWEPYFQLQGAEWQLGVTRLVTHYWGNGCFLADGQILNGMPRLAEIPAVLIHGRYDVSGPLDTAWHLHRAWPGSKLVVLDDAGHGGGGFQDEIIAALDSFRGLATA